MRYLQSTPNSATSSPSRDKRFYPALVLLCLVFCAFTGITPARSQGTVTGATITTSVPSVTVPVGTPATFTATVSGAKANPDQYWTVISGPTYSWWGYGANDPATTPLSYTFSSAGTNTSSPTCVVSYVVQYARGGTATISMTAKLPQDTSVNPPKDGAVPIYVIGGPISGTNDIRYFCDSSISSYWGKLSAASGQPTGTTYSWSLAGNAQFVGGAPTSASVSYAGKGSGSTTVGDVKATVTYSLNGVTATSDPFPITVHAPKTFAITATTPANKTIPPASGAYGFSGQSITFQVLDGLKLPMQNAYWDESWSQPNGGGQPGMVGGGPLDAQGYSVDNFSIQGANQPTNTNGDKIFGPLTHIYSVTDTGGTGGNIGCPVQTYSNVYYYTYGITGNGF